MSIHFENLDDFYTLLSNYGTNNKAHLSELSFSFRLLSNKTEALAKSIKK